MKKTLFLGILIVLMIFTSILYFTFAMYGEVMETNNPIFKRGQNEIILSTDTHTENEEKILENTSHTLNEEVNEESSEEVHQLSQNSSEEITNELEHNENAINANEGEVHSELKENVKRNIEMPFLLFVGIAYVALAIWVFISKTNRKLPYIIIIIGSGILVGLYIISRTVGFPQIGIEPVGPFDLMTNILQIGIIIFSIYLLRYIKELNDKSKIIH